LDLDEPYRTVVLLRFFEELPPRAIAKRTGRPVETVRKQTQRGLERLREALQARYGDRGAWAVALLPLAGPGVVRAGAGAAAIAGGGGSLGWMAFALRAAAVAAVLAVAGFLVARVALDRDAPEPGNRTVVRTAAVPGAQADETASIVAPTMGRVGETAAEHDHEADDHSAEAKALAPLAASLFALDVSPLRARVVGLDTKPLADVALVWSPGRGRDPVMVRSTDEGWIDSDEVPGGHEVAGRLRPVDERWTLLDVGKDADDEIVVVLAPAVAVAGQAVGPDGGPIARATVRIEAALPAVPEFDLDLDLPTYRSTRSVTTNEEGAFDLGRVPSHPAFRITASRPGFTALNGYDVPTHDDLGLQLVLREEARVEYPVVSGVVYEASGALAPGVTVRFASDSAVTDESGRFRIVVKSWPTDEIVTARARDGRFVTAAPPTRDEAMDKSASMPLVLRLPSSMGLLLGQVVDESGAPVEGVEVHLVDGTQVGWESRVMESMAQKNKKNGNVATDERGVFTFRSVADRSYWIRILDPSTMLVHDVKGARPSSELLRIVLPADRLVDRIEGTVVDVHGAPVQGAEVRLRATLLQFSSGASSRGGDPVVTDERGRFALENAPWRGLEISVDARPNDYRGGTDFPLGDAPPTSPLRLEIERDCDVVLRLVGEPEVDEVEVQHEAGGQLTIVEIRSTALSYRRRVPRTADGQFALFEVSQRAASLVLMGDGVEIRRVPIRLDPTERNVIDL
ncbi:MAG: sigma factor-like helix-turn-helix DNA-binding protein, partial [Planctomycetota bacterium]